MKLFIMCGCSGVGKSTWISKNKLPKSEVISPDEERRALGSVNDQSVSAKAFANCYAKLKASKAENVYFDATSLNIKSLNGIVACVPDAEITLVLFDNSANAEFCLKNVRKDIANKVDRSNTPEEVIRNMSERYKTLTSGNQLKMWISAHKANVIHVK